MEVQWTYQNSDNGTYGSNVYFLPELGVDPIQTGNNVTELSQFLNATIQKLNVNFAVPAQIQVDIWKLLNWIYVVQYWSLLYDVGQLQPTLYARSTGEFPDTYIPNDYPTTNNIFTNDTLFTIYGDYFVNTILPLLEIANGANYGNYTFQSLGSNNVLESVDVAFDLAYSCTQSKLKKPLSLIVSVLIGDYVFLNPALGFIVIFGAWYQRRRNPGEGTLMLLLRLIVANRCEGCIEKESKKN